MYSTIVPYVNLSGGCGYFIFLIDTKISKFCHGISPTVHRFHQLLFSEIFKNIQMFCSFLFKAMHSHISYNFHFISASEIFPKDLYTIYRKDRTGRKRGGGVYSWQSQLTSYHQNNLSWTLIAKSSGQK